MNSEDAYGPILRAGWLMLVLNAIFCVVKLTFGWVGGSFALTADGVNNLADVAISLVLFVGIHYARRPPDREHAYGHGKMEQEVSRLISIVVLATGGGIVVGGANSLGDMHVPLAHKSLPFRLLPSLLRSSGIGIKTDCHSSWAVTLLPPTR